MTRFEQRLEHDTLQPINFEPVIFEPMETATVVLVPGAFHPPECFNKFTPHLTDLGLEVLTPDIPSNKPGTTWNDYAEAVAEKIDDRNDVVAVGFSRGGHTIQRLPFVIPGQVKRLVYVGAALPPAANQPLKLSQSEVYDDYSDGFIEEADGTYTYDPELAAAKFCQDCDPEDQDQLVGMLRNQNRDDQVRDENGNVLPVPFQPDIPTYVIIALKDAIRRKEHGRVASIVYMGTKAIELMSDHTPQLSEPNALARIIHSTLTQPPEEPSTRPKVHLPAESMFA